MDTILGTVVALTVIFIVVAVIWAIIKYILDGFGLMEMAKTKNEKYPWLAWIPWAKEYLRGKIAYDTDHGAAIYLGVTIGVNVITSVISFVSGYVSGLNDGASVLYIIVSLFTLILIIGYSVFYYITQHRIYNKFSKNATIMTIFTVLTGGFLAPIFNFAIRKNNLEE